MITILHVSDTHGREVKLRPEGDIVVHSGDLMGNVYASRSMWSSMNMRYQNARMAEDGKWWARELDGRPLVLIPGNHDYYTNEGLDALIAAGVDLSFMVDGVVEVQEVAFYGFPWTPLFCDWNWMCDEDDLEQKLRAVPEGIDVFVSHGPMYGTLDANACGEHCGSHALNHFFRNRKGPPPAAFLHGHIHEQGGCVIPHYGMQISNAACTQNLVTL